MVEKYYKLTELINFIDQPNKQKCLNFYQENKQMFEKASGSKTKHQSWKGGYADHIRDVMNIAVRLFNNLNDCRELPFSLSDSLLVLFLHDLEKLWKYGGNDEQLKEFNKFPDYQEFILHKIKEYGIELNDAQLNGLKYVHGEGSDYDPDVRIQLPLAAFVHVCDSISARIWFDFPKSDTEW